MAGYYAFDMVNGKTLIGKPDEKLNKDSNKFFIDDVVVIETLTNQMRSPTSYDYMYADIKKQYINTYRDAVRKINFELPTIGLDKIGNSSSGGPMNVVVPWYLGEDILIVKKVNKGNI